MKNILIIEDENDIANNIKAILADENYNCVVASNSHEAFDCIANLKFNLIILDVWLDNSELDGIQILKNIRENSLIPIIIIVTVCWSYSVYFLGQKIKRQEQAYMEQDSTEEKSKEGEPLLSP